MIFAQALDVALPGFASAAECLSFRFGGHSFGLFSCPFFAPLSLYVLYTGIRFWFLGFLALCD